MIAGRRSVMMGVGALALGATSVEAQDDFPGKPITLICPWPAGGGADQHMRVLAQAASKHLKQPIHVDNRAGGAGVSAPAQMAATAKPDGYTIGQIVLTVFRAPYTTKVTYDPLKDFTYIALVGGFLIGAFVKNDSAIRSLPEFLAFARHNPGKATYGTPGVGTTNHLSLEQVALKAGVRLTHVPFRGEAGMYAAVVGSHVMAGGGAGALVDAGELRWINTFGTGRPERWPGVPTARELGFDVVAQSPYGIAGPKGMDPRVVRILNDAIATGLREPEHIAFLKRNAQPELYLDSAAYTREAAETFRREGEILKSLGLARKE